MATKKTPAKKSTTKQKKSVASKARTEKKAPEIKHEPVETKPLVLHSPSTTTTNNNKKRISRTIITIAVIIVILALAYLFRSAFVVGFVNGQPITRTEFNHTMEKDDGKQAMNEIVTQDLVFQQAQQRHIIISDAEVNSQLNSISDTLKKQGQTLDQALSDKGLTKQDLIDQIKIKLIVDKILGSQVKVTDQQVTDYINNNKDSLPQGQSDAQMRASVKQQLQQDQLSQKFQDWISGLQQKAKIDYLIKI